MIRLVMVLFMLVLVGCGLRPPPPSAARAPVQNPGVERTDVLIYGGLGAWSEELDSIKKLLIFHKKTYVEYNDEKMNGLTAEELKTFSLVIFAGGNSDSVSKNLTLETKRRLRAAVIDDGLNYLGLCSGAWLVIEPNERDEHYGFQLLEGPWLKFASIHEGMAFQINTAQFPGGVSRRLLWFGGPITPEIPGGVIARYEDGTPAITQMKAGKGFVIISGLHPTATKDMLEDLSLYEKEAVAPELAWAMIEAALYGKPMAAFIE